MKLLKRLLVTCLAIALVAMMPFGGGSVKAENPHTYTVKWIPEMNEWRVQQLATWDSSRENGDMNYLWGNIQSGDSLVIIGDSTAPKFEDLHIKFNLANLTLFGVTSSIIVYAEQNIKEIYVLKGTIASLHGSYDNIYIYDNCACNVNNDVSYLQISGETSMSMNVAALGTVGHCKIDNKGTLIREMYNVKAGALRVEDGTDKTDPSTYSTTATAAPAAAATTNTTPASTAGTTNTAGGTVSPKTGEGSLPILLMVGAVFCLVGTFAARKKAA